MLLLRWSEEHFLNPALPCVTTQQGGLILLLFLVVALAADALALLERFWGIRSQCHHHSK